MVPPVSPPNTEQPPAAAVVGPSKAGSVAFVLLEHLFMISLWLGLAKSLPLVGGGKPALLVPAGQWPKLAAVLCEHHNPYQRTGPVRAARQTARTPSRALTALPNEPKS